MDKKNYLKQFSALFFEDLEKIKLQAQNNHIPLVDEEVGQILYFLCRLVKPKKVLEIGFGSGYSTLWIAKAVSLNSSIISLEKNKERYENGLKIIENHKNISLFYRDALEYLRSTTDFFDFVFIDAVKSQYLDYFRLLENKITPGGLVIADNIFYRDKVLDINLSSKKKEEIEKLQEFCFYLKNQKEFETLFLIDGDGLSISRKKEVECAPFVLP